MAGKENHHIWRMLQRGFGEQSGKDHHIWVYRKGTKPSQKGTGNFGVEKFFYGPEGSETDKRITEFENSVQSGIQDMRKMDGGAELDAAFVAPLIAHLEMRSKFLRSEISNITERMLTTLEEYFSSTTKVQSMLKDYLRRNPEKFDAFLAKNFVPVAQRENASKLVDTHIDNLPPNAADELFGGKLAEIREMARLVPESIKESHNEAILSIERDSPRVKKLEEFAYTIYRPHNGQLVLPDTCCAFAGSKNVAPFSQPKDGIQTVIIPISAEVAIFGQRGKQRSMELKTINRLLAGCAYEAFIAKSDDPEFARLAGRIGKHAKMISDKEIRELFSFERLLSD